MSIPLRQIMNNSESHQVTDTIKTLRLTLSLLISGFLLTPAAMAQDFGIDQEYNNSLNNNSLNSAQFSGEAAASTASTGSAANTTETNAWSDYSYVQGQQDAPHIPGTSRAPLQQLSQGMASTFVGNNGQFIRGKSRALGKRLPKMQNGLNAINSGYFGPACDYAGPGGFFGGLPSFSSPYPFLPPTSTSFVDLNVAIP